MPNQFRFTCLCMIVTFFASTALAVDGWLQLDGGDGPGQRKNIVLISGDEEYRTEESMPMLARILSVHHGFDCTVVFSMSPDGQYIDPNNGKSLEGIEALKFADLMIIGTRFRKPNDDTMKYIDDYVQSGKPIIGLRTATHAFNGIKGKYAHYNNGYGGEHWKGGFGREILGEKWISHHGRHKKQATGGVIVESQREHPILRGVKASDVWGPSDVYGVRLPLPGDSEPLVLGAVLEGMEVGDKPADSPKNDPMMPVVWTKTYTSDQGKTGRVVNTTMGASTDFILPGLRRIIVNSVFWTLGMEDAITPDLNVDFVGDFQPTKYGFTPNDGIYWKEKNQKPSDWALPSKASSSSASE